jgi:DNA-binding CsgD family transcriptional regulator
MSLKTRKTGLAILGDVPWGSHLCLFYETKQDLLDTVVPYFRAGLENNEFCVWAVSGPLDEDEARIALDQGIPSFGDHAAGVEIIPGREWYLGDGQADPKKITNGWQAKLATALAQGYEGIRVSGNAFWLGTAYWNVFREYEQQLNGAFAGSRMIALCTYPFTASRATDVLDVARAHGVAVARRNGNWEFIETAEIQTRLLTPREREVLTWVARGKSASDIGKILRIAKRTVDEHAQSAVRKLGAQNRAQAVAIASRGRIIEVDTPLSA